MKVILSFILALSLLTSCTAKKNGFSEFEYKGSCGGDSNVSGWWYVKSLPEDATKIRGLVEANTTLKKGMHNFAVESWFMNSESEVMVCRTNQAPKDSCTGEWWVFSKQNEEWVLIDESGWVCFSD